MVAVPNQSGQKSDRLWYKNKNTIAYLRPWAQLRREYRASPLMFCFVVGGFMASTLTTIVLIVLAYIAPDIIIPRP